jgi:hypothetical protein
MAYVLPSFSFRGRTQKGACFGAMCWICLEKDGAGEGIRTLDPNLGKVEAVQRYHGFDRFPPKLSPMAVRTFFCSALVTEL